MVSPGSDLPFYISIFFFVPYLPSVNKILPVHMPLEKWLQVDLRMSK